MLIDKWKTMVQDVLLDIYWVESYWRTTISDYIVHFDL